MPGENFLKLNGNDQTTGTAHRTHRQFWQAALMVLPATAACGQATPGNAQTSERPFTVQEVAKFSTPWAIDFLPGSGVPLSKMALVSEKEGKLWLVDTATGAKQEVAGVPAASVAGQGGLGDVVVHPGFAGNQRIYLSFVREGRGGSARCLLRAVDLGTRAADRGLQDHLAAREGVGQRPFQHGSRSGPMACST